MANDNLKAAHKAKNDEFYTQLSDIAAEIGCYEKYFKDAVVLCNCDDPEWSNFWKYFHLYFKEYGIKKLISTHYNTDGSPSYKMEYTGGNDQDTKVANKIPLQGNGDFASQECIDILKEADIVATNPPFSKFRQYVDLLMKHNKKFIIIGHQNAITYKEIFPLIKENKIWLGYGFKGNVGFFESPYEDRAVSSQHKEGMIRVSGVMWFTNLDIPKRHISLIDTLQKSYEMNPNSYYKYDNYNAINVDKTKDIPYDYNGVMGVPITFLDKFNPDEFEIMALGNSRDNFTPTKDYENPKKHTKDGKVVNGGAINCVLAIEHDEQPINCVYYTSDNSKYLVPPYARILIKRKDPYTE